MDITAIAGRASVGSPAMTQSNQPLRKPRCRICGTTVWVAAPKMSQRELEELRATPVWGTLPPGYVMPTGRVGALLTNWLCKNGHGPNRDQHDILERMAVS